MLFRQSCSYLQIHKVVHDPFPLVFYLVFYYTLCKLLHSSYYTLLNLLYFSVSIQTRLVVLNTRATFNSLYT